MFEALGRVMYRRRRWVVALSLAFVVFAGVWGTGVFGAMTGGGFEDPDSDSSRAAEVAVRELGRDSSDVVVLYRSDDRPSTTRLPGRGGRLPERAARRPRRPDDDLLEHRVAGASSATTGSRPSPSCSSPTARTRRPSRRSATT